MGLAVLAKGADAICQFGGCKAIGQSRQGDHRLDDQMHPRLVEIDSPDLGLAHLRGSRETLEQIIADEALIDAR